MIRILLKKEMSQIKKMYLTNKRRGKQGGNGLFVFLIICYFLIMLSMGALDSLFAYNLIPAGNGWLYYFFISIFSLVAGIIGSVFTTAEMLFKAKDNEFLMAMPIPPSSILFVRMVSVYIMGLIYELLFMLPGVILYFIFAGVTILNLLFGILGIILLGFIILVFSCLFGWIVAIITAKLKNKTFLTVLISIIFIGLFVFFRFKANDFFKNLIMNAEVIGESVLKMGYPFYAPGRGMTGDIPGMLFFAGITGVLFGITYFIISKSFNKVVNIKPSEKNTIFSDSKIKTKNADRALAAKELRRFLSSPGYMLNCGLGLLFLAAGTVAALIASRQLVTLTESITVSLPAGKRMIIIIAAFAVCLLSGLVDIAAPSISLEGQSIWILQTLPVTPLQVFRAKFKPAALITAIPSIICSVVLLVVLKADIAEIVSAALCTASFVIFITLLSLRLDLGRPFLDWTNEIQPIKQNISIMITLLTGMLGPLIPAGLYLLLAPVILPAIYLIIWMIIFLLLSLLLVNWFRKTGTQKFKLLGQ